jgi:hypothetical protein
LIPFFLYLVAGAVTGFHVYFLLVLAAFGAPANPLELVSLVGSLCLIVAAYLSLFKPHAAARLALLAALAIWCFYGPAIVRTAGWFRTRMMLPYLATALLALVTAYSAFVSFRQQRDGSTAAWIFPNGTRRSAQIAVGICTLALFVGVAGWLTIDARHSIRHASRFLIPEGYVGWVRVEFLIKDAPALPIEGGECVFKFPASGLLRTGSSEEYGWAKDHYFYYSEKGTRMLLDTAPGGGGLIWGKINGEESGSQGKRKYEEFFVGTEQQFGEQTRGEHNFGPSALGTPAK